MIGNRTYDIDIKENKRDRWLWAFLDFTSLQRRPLYDDIQDNARILKLKYLYFSITKCQFMTETFKEDQMVSLLTNKPPFINK